jgi:hypothetical protein
MGSSGKHRRPRSPRGAAGKARVCSKVPLLDRTVEKGYLVAPADVIHILHCTGGRAAIDEPLPHGRRLVPTEYILSVPDRAVQSQCPGAQFGGRVAVASVRFVSDGVGHGARAGAFVSVPRSFLTASGPLHVDHSVVEIEGDVRRVHRRMVRRFPRHFGSSAQCSSPKACSWKGVR